MALFGGEVRTIPYQSPDYSGSVQAARGLAMASAQGISQGITQAQDYFKQQGEKKKLIKQSDIQIDAALKLFPDLAPTLQGVRDQIRDENVPLNERAGIAESVAGLINMGTSQMQSMAELGLKKRQLDIQEGQGIQSALMEQAKMQAEANKPGEIINIAVPGGTQQMIRDRVTGELKPIEFPSQPQENVIVAPPVVSDGSLLPVDIPTTTGEFVPANEGVISPDKTTVEYLGKTYVIDYSLLPSKTVDEAVDVQNAISLTPTANIPSTPIAAGIDSALAASPQRIGFAPTKGEKGEVVTTEEAQKRVASGLSVTSTPIGGGMVRITSQTGSPKPSPVIESPESKLQTQRLLELDKSLGSLREAGTTASLDVEPLKEITNLLDTKVKTGFGRETLMQARKILGQDVSNEEQFQARVGAEAMKNIALTKGAISDREMDYFKTVLSPNMGKTTEGNKKIIDFRIKYANRANKISETISDLQEQGKSPFEIKKAIDKIISSESLLDKQGSDKSEVNQAESDAEFLKGFQ